MVDPRVHSFLTFSHPSLQKMLFTVLLAISAVAGVLALPNLSKRSTPAGTGTSGGYYYSFYNENSGPVTFNAGNGGEYSVTWDSGTSDFVAGKGWSTGAARYFSSAGHV